MAGNELAEELAEQFFGHIRRLAAGSDVTTLALLLEMGEVRSEIHSLRQGLQQIPAAVLNSLPRDTTNFTDREDSLTPILRRDLPGTGGSAPVFRHQRNGGRRKDGARRSRRAPDRAVVSRFPALSGSARAQRRPPAGHVGGRAGDPAARPGRVAAEDPRRAGRAGGAVALPGQRQARSTGCWTTTRPSPRAWAG